MNNKAFENEVDSTEYGKSIALESKSQNGNGDLNGTITLETAGSSTTQNSEPEREGWGKGIEFLMSCIAMSVGLGNVWRFPFTALDNGGGAFLLPYLIVLFVIGRPLYFLEMVIGQFSSRNSINVFDISPFFRGAGVGQIIAIFLLSTYYASIMALIGRYLYDSFQSPLPWTICKEDWVNCVSPNTSLSMKIFTPNATTSIGKMSSSEYYFTREVLQEAKDINDGIGAPILNLTIFLLLAWIVIAAVLIKGIQSSGKASYFLALFPYVVIGILLIRAVTLPGAWNGILYFIKPRWEKILEPSVWYAAVTQCFFSLAVGFGNLIMYSSFNKFNHNVYRDATIVTSLDTFTSLFAGFTIFGILGHLAHEIKTDDIKSVVNGGSGLAFISYPEAIARFQQFPQMFSILFFFMLFVLGIGSNIAMCTCIITILRDKFTSLKAWQAAIGLSFVGFSVGIAYVTPGGQHLLSLVDFYGASFIVFILAIGEIVAVCWIYGVNRLCRDIEFMISVKPGLYWRVCWAFLTPLLMFTILIYTFINYKPLTYKDQPYPAWATSLGWTVSAVGVAQLPLWAGYAYLKYYLNDKEKMRSPLQPTANWGPKNPQIFEKYQMYVSNYEEQQRLLPKGNLLVRMKRHIFG
ncbi:sodium-dependent nutrient amino acid transporter 1-like [Contarinia nasturtii]|uniref:sodium-dependent nutrient amino acid transporter 1-like n=1 Tax=Contarinia nasturtii TaxID=265458 RepID=UPI0012D40FD5|nr:sodium-dependent nutrient amino acid transporter 1-like [Contarinia nasturtii]XP_031621111.1 sodium-dependent nutrient amino acid transporter 1-like [Contarinia nasturtii]